MAVTAPLLRSCRPQCVSPNKICSQTVLADPTLNAQLHRAAMFPMRNSPHFGVCFVLRSGFAQYQKAEKVGNSVQVDMEG